MGELHPVNQRELETIANRLALAREEVQQLCSGKRRWTMCIPVQEHDSDIIISSSLNDLARLIGEVQRLSSVLKQLRQDEPSVEDMP